MTIFHELLITWIYCICCSVTQLCPTLCEPMDCSMPGLPVHHQLPELAQTHVHWVSDAIQPSHPLSTPSPPAFNPSQHQGLFQWVNSSYYGQSIAASASTSVLPMNIQGWFPLGPTGWISLLSKGLSRVFSSTTVQGINSLALRLFYCPALMSVRDYWKRHSFDYVDLCRHLYICALYRAAPVAQMEKNTPAMQETWVWSLGQEHPLEKGMAIHSRISIFKRPPPLNQFLPSYLCWECTGDIISSVAQSCLTLCDPMVCRMPGLPVHHQLPELAQTHVHRVGDAIQPSHPLSFLCCPAFNLSQHQGLFQWVSSSYQVTKVLELQLQHQSFQWIFRTDFL